MLGPAGSQYYRSALPDAELSLADAAFAELAGTGPGTRVHGHPRIVELASRSGAAGAIAAALLGPRAIAVRTILFDKTRETNWSLGWHQDRTIAVVRRIDVAGFGPWTLKRGVTHVEPPSEFVERMVTLRLHLDDVDAANGPLRVSPGSHLKRRIAEREIDLVVASCGEDVHLALRGDIYAYATLILHRSTAATRPRTRRVVQFDFSADSLPGGLEWIGV